MKKNILLKTWVLLILLCFMLGGGDVMAQAVDLSPAEIKAVMIRVADWDINDLKRLEQSNDKGRRHPVDWTYAALYAGVSALARMEGMEKYSDELLRIGSTYNWQTRNKTYHADDHGIGKLYIEMYKKHGKPEILEGIRGQFDEILADPPAGTLDAATQEKGKDRWWWCDALFMAPPVWAGLANVTGNPAYRDFMNREWWATTDYLFDKEDHLYFRDGRFISSIKEDNGKKMFWSRGNGWVMGAYPAVLMELPEDYPDRGRYEDVFRKMAAKLVAIQPEDGMWRASLLAPELYPVKESSGTGFYCFALAWGINHGLLDEKTYLPAVIKAWKGLVECVQPDGMLGYVQGVGGRPKPTAAPDRHMNYAGGAFLLAGSEMYKIAVRNGAPVKKIAVTNPVSGFRKAETVELDLAEMQKAVPGLTKDNVAVFDFASNSFPVSQVVEDGSDAKIIFQTSLAPNERKHFWVMKRPGGVVVAEPEIRAFARFVPERKDDFAWENDRVAFRMYGPALEDETITSGIDAWSKCVRYPIVNKFYKNGDYHKNHGEGGDFFKVGNTLGCGGSAPFTGGRVILPDHNFKEWLVISAGPVRAVFELTYAPWKAGDVTVGLKKRITLDLGSNLNRVECFYSCEGAGSVPVAAGIVLQKSDQKLLDAKSGVAAYWLPAGQNDGMLGCGMVSGPGADVELTEADGHLLMAAANDCKKPFVYYAGSCWSQNEEFGTFEKWQEYLRIFKQRIDNPVKITK